jgi:glycosyltransferase involved in cell wall biosynthesis
MEKPLVSVVMAAYNEELYISEAINSILEQTYTNFEFIIINDGSSDMTERIILSYGDERIKYLRNETNLKLIKSLNKGLELAKGKYIARMDADDIAMPERLETQVLFMENHPHIGISGSQLEVFGQINSRMNFPLTHEDLKLNLLITSAFGNNVVILRRSVLEKFGLVFPLGYIHAEDYKCWTMWLMKSIGANIEKTLVKYRSHQNSMSVKNRKIQIVTRNRIRIEYLRELFNLEDNLEVAANFYMPIGWRRIGAIRTIEKLNKRRQIFPPRKLRATIQKLWYLDSLEGVESNAVVLFRFPLIFCLGVSDNAMNWLYLFKHFVKQRYLANE